jgi:hypothetical protein
MRKIMPTVQHKSSGRGSLLLLGGLIVSIPLAPVTGGASVAIAMGAAGIVYLSGNQSRAVQSMDFVGGYKNLFAASGGESSAFRDQNGWNWSSRPKKKGEEVFTQVLCSINERRQLDIVEHWQGNFAQSTRTYSCED